MRGKLKRFCIAMISALTMISCTGVTAYAAAAETVAETVHVAGTQGKAGNTAVVLTSLRITGLTEPVAGEPLAASATIVSAEGVSWDIPVVWTDENRKVVTVAEPGHRYYPTFSFYVPAGYRIGGTDAAGRFPIAFPAFLRSVTDQLVFLVDPSSQIVYVYYSEGVSVGGSVPAPEEGTGTTAPEQEQEEPERIVPYVSDRVRLYCSPSAIETLGNDLLEEVIDLVKNVIEPQAVNALRSGFTQSFGSAAAGTGLSSEIGLYIYYRTGEIDGQPASPNALAYVQSNYDSNNQFRQIMAIDMSSFAVYNGTTGRWEMNPQQDVTFDNTVVHEMLHALMNDYTRYGMYRTIGEGGTVENGQGFPNWFVEGIASAVDNVYQFRYDIFGAMMVNNSYTPASVLAGYTNTSLTGNDRLDLSHCDETQNTGSAYVAGYLATLYLGYLAAEYGTNPAHVFDAEDNVNMNNLRTGVDRLLLWLHGDNNGGQGDALSMDDIITGVSGYRTDPSTGYSSTADFQQKFIQGTNEGNVNATTGLVGSLEFTSRYLQWLNNQGSNERRAHGSILYSDQNYDTPIYRDTPAVTGGLYAISEEGGMAVSSVDDLRASSTGGTTTVGPLSEDSSSGRSRPARADNDEYDAAAKAEGSAEQAVDPAASGTDTTGSDVQELAANGAESSVLSDGQASGGSQDTTMAGTAPGQRDETQAASAAGGETPAADASSEGGAPAEPASATEAILPPVEDNGTDATTQADGAGNPAQETQDSPSAEGQDTSLQDAQSTEEG